MDSDYIYGGAAKAVVSRLTVNQFPCGKQCEFESHLPHQKRIRFDSFESNAISCNKSFCFSSFIIKSLLPMFES